MLEHTARGQPEGEVLVGRFRRRLIRQGKDHGLAVAVAVELVARSRFHIRIRAFAVAPARFLAVHHGPAQAAHLVVFVEGRQVMPVAAAESRVLFEQALLHIEAEMLRLVVLVGRVGLRCRELVDLAVAVEHIEQGLAPQFGALGQQLLGPDFLDLEALGKLHQLPQVRTRFIRSLHQLVPEVGTPLGVAVGAFLFHPHRRRQDQVGSHGGHRRVGIGNHDEVVRVAVARIAFLRQVGAGLHVVVHHHPVGIELAVLEHAVLLHGVVARLGGNGAGRQLPQLFGGLAVLGVGDHHVGGQAVREGAHLARRAAGRRLARQGERAVAGRGDLSGQQVDVVDQVVGPGPARVLVEAHGPERHDLAIRVGIQLRQCQQAVGRHAGHLRRVLQGVSRDELGKLLERRGLGAVGIGGVLGRLLQRVLGTQAVAYVGIAHLEIAVLGHEVLVHTPCRDDVVGDVVQYHQVGLGLESQLQIGQLVRAMLERGQHGHLHIGRAQAAVRHTGPEHRVHLRHVRAPEHEGIGGFDVVIAAHGLVHAESAHETRHGRCHAVARIRVDVVGAKAALEQLGGGIAFPDRPLARTEHAHGCRPLVLDRFLELLGHDVEGHVPGHMLELAFLGVLAVLHAQHGLGQAVLAVHDLGQEIALDAVETAVHFRFRVALRGHHAVVLDGHHHAAARAAEAARRLGPGQLGIRAACDLLGHGLDGNSRHGPCSRGRGLTNEITPSAGHGRPPGSENAGARRVDRRERR
ncbi:hypothetical protein D3C78_785700 [compost metagenome]